MTYEIRSRYYGTQKFRRSEDFGHLERWSGESWAPVYNRHGELIDASGDRESFANACESWWDAYMIRMRKLRHRVDALGMAAVNADSLDDGV